MNKVFGKKSEYIPLREDGTRNVVSYGFEEVDAEHATWWEVYLPKKQVPVVTLPVVKEAVEADIDERTVERIVSGFEWEPEADGKEQTSIHVWLSKENQMNLGDLQRVAAMQDEDYEPVEYKIGETEDGEAVMYRFETLEELTRFYVEATRWRHSCLHDGWVEKQSIDWSVYGL